MNTDFNSLSKDLNDNVTVIMNIFQNDQTIIKRYVENPYDTSIQCCVLFSDGMVDYRIINEDIIKPILDCRIKKKSQDFTDVIAKRIASTSNVETTADLEKIARALVCGDSILLVDGCINALILNSKGWKSRTITEPENEKALRGPREGFNESLMINLSMLRRRLQSQELKLEFKTFGTRTKTKACISYIDGLVSKEVLTELEARLCKYDLDGAIDSNYIAECIKDEPYSPFKTIGSTERPDVVAAKLLEGRIALFVDGTPMVLTLPLLFVENFQSSDDYYLNFYFASFGRLLRILAFFISTSVPAIYVALTTFHAEILPTDLSISISMARQNVPLPTVVEAAVMILVFEILRETGLRAPLGIGQALSIVGALVLGQAAVDAKLVSAPMIIIVSLSGITGIMIPSIKGALILLRYIFLVLSSIIGLYGYMFGMMGLLLYLINIRSFGIPFLGGIGDYNLQESKDIFFRMPWWIMKKRPKFMSSDPVRSDSDGDKR